MNRKIVKCQTHFPHEHAGNEIMRQWAMAVYWLNSGAWWHKMVKLNAEHLLPNDNAIESAQNTTAYMGRCLTKIRSA